ncbi:MAG: metallophosphoesterase, partial [Okeania sp. SIO2H7]|nr:metallophosphoesterase [Okeania sp. SIO2H7]
MWFWSWHRRLVFTFLIGISLATVLHSCQLESRQQELSSSPDASVVPSELSQGAEDSSVVVAAFPTELSPEAQAIVDEVGHDGLYNPPRGDVRLVVISDLNGAYGATDYDPEVDKAIALLPFWNPDVVICGGDMVAGQKVTLSDAELQAMWAAFDAHVAAPLRQMEIPYGFTLGNHDASGAQDGSGGL